MTASCGPAEVDGHDEVRVDAAGPDDWADWRALRLEALRDTPIGFVQTVEQAQVMDEVAWRRRMVDVPCSVLARQDGRPVAMASGAVVDGAAHLIAVYLTPPARGRGLLCRLVQAVAAWADGPLVLEVHQDNARAITAYGRLGFVDTGQRRPYPLGPDRDEIVMARPAAPS